MLYETLRLFPPVCAISSMPLVYFDTALTKVIGIPKIAAEDTAITFENQTGEKKTVPVPKGSRFMIDTPGLHHNRKPFEVSCANP